LSQLTEASTPSAGEPARFEKLTWTEFVQRSLELTVEAYKAMRQACVAQQDWEENVLTLCLGYEYLSPIAFDNAIRVLVGEKVHTPEMIAGRQATSEAGEIDMSLFGSWERNYHQIHFVWEAKKVGDKRVNGDYSRFNSEYVNEGIYRFIREEYADGLDDAGMLGYVLAGSVPNIVSDINSSMSNIRKNPPLPESDHLQKAVPIGDFDDRYRSNHRRTDQTGICLHHLFLTFDFEQ
jgi:hypothetical protein